MFTDFPTSEKRAAVMQVVSPGRDGEDSIQVGLELESRSADLS